MRARVFALLLAVCPLGAQTPTRLVTGIVTALETARPLDQARVTLLPAGRATFTANNGAFALTAVPLGRVRVRVARIGFVPVDTIFDVTEGTEPLRLLFRLNRLTVTLSTVTVLAFPPCAKPGPPTLARDGPDAMKLFEQVQEIAAQNRLLADSFPFLYHVERETVALRRSGDSIIEKIDSVAVQSNGEPLRYRPGRLVRRQADLTFALRLPSLADVAEPEFVRWHCFHFTSGTAILNGAFIRVDFRAAQRIREPDVHGTILLDPVTFQIRRATFELSKVPKEIPDLRAAVFEADFAEVVPSIVIFERVTGRSVLTPMRERNPVTEIIERQKLIAFRFLHRDPRVAPPSP